MKTTIPVALIEAAIDTVTAFTSAADLKEFRRLGETRLERLVDTPIATTDVERGFVLGCEAMRRAIQSRPDVQMAGLDL